ncbi:MAG: beta-ketoacyl-[acyl-carrier-protein] synthase II, partial [Proteobacteria bacterium]|nr:beta-ketoacyl-[acyl-carrier-protein] synthase II [Pseudomonadota bacterium]
MKQRAVITGIGATTPLGVNVEDFWSSAIDGKSGIEKITAFDVSANETKVAAMINMGEIKYGPELKESDIKIETLSKGVQFAI